MEYRTSLGNSTAQGNELTGLVTPFNTWTVIGDMSRGGFQERIANGAFTATLQQQDVVLVNSHDTSQPMARMSAGTLQLSEVANVGLVMRATVANTSYGRDVLELVRAGIVRGMSFGFEVIADDWTDDVGNASDSMRGTQRTIQEIRLFEVTTTAFPAYPTTDLQA